MVRQQTTKAISQIPLIINGSKIWQKAKKNLKHPISSKKHITISINFHYLD